MNSENPKQSSPASTAQRSAVASNDSTLTDMPGPSLLQRFEAGALRHTSAELGYGCVDWFIYGAETRVAPAPLRG